MDRLGIFGILVLLAVGSIGIVNAQNAKPVQDIVYTAKFVCGSIMDSDGPLRPGHYDTSIDILNNKGYKVNIVWSAVINDGPTSNAILKNLQAENSTGISCRDIKGVFGIDTKEMLEGFVLIKVPVSSLKGFDNEQVIPDLSQDASKILDVHVFYSANALETLPHEIAVEKISFYIIQDGNHKIPKESFRKLLDVNVPIKLNDVLDVQETVRSFIATKYSLDKNDLDKIVLRIKDTSISVSTMLDDHAVSLHVVQPRMAS